MELDIFFLFTIMYNILFVNGIGYFFFPIFMLLIDISGIW